MRYSSDNKLTITTPDGITFSFQLAGPITRFLAWVIDFFVISAIGSLISMVTTLIVLISPGFARAAGIIGYFVISIGYSIFMEWRFKGQTIGKRIIKIRVMDERGLNLHFGQIFIRNIFRTVDSFPLFYLVGGLTALFSRKSQRAGDFAANTVVVNSSIDRSIFISTLPRPKYNSFSSMPHLAARLRQRTSPMELHLAVDALQRRDAFNLNDRVKLFRELTCHFASKVTFPSHIVEHLTDEQYLRNVVDSIFSTTVTTRLPSKNDTD